MLISLPDGVKPGDFRNHPVTQALRDSCHRNGLGLPTKAQLDALKLPPLRREQLAKACREVAALCDDGFMEQARMNADQIAAQILSELPIEYRDPDYLDSREDDVDNFGPAELADLVRGGANGGSFR